MKKVFQTIIDKGNGNCMQATVASLFELPLDEVPHFLELGDKGMSVYMQFFMDRGYDITFCHRTVKSGLWELKNLAKFDKGIGGYRIASVPSQTYEGVSHAVIVDNDLNIVHDPNPNQKCIGLDPENITNIEVYSDLRRGRSGNLYTTAEWESLPKIQREAETFTIDWDKQDHLLWLDDSRDPYEDDCKWQVFSPIEQPYICHWIKSYDQFVWWISRFGIPKAVCFDHDLGKNPDGSEQTGYDCAKWLVNYCMDNNLSLPLYNIQSGNNVGKENIQIYLENFKRNWVVEE